MRSGAAKITSSQQQAVHLENSMLSFPEYLLVLAVQILRIAIEFTKYQRPVSLDRRTHVPCEL